MKAPLRLIYTLTSAVLVGQLCAPCQVHGPKDNDAPRTVSVSDMIQMIQPGEDTFQGSMVAKDDIGIFSPDRAHFLILLKRGDIERNTNEYWIKCYRSNGALKQDTGTTLIQLVSASSSPAISQLRWLNNKTITFLGESSHSITQLYSLDIKTKRLIRLTNSQESLTGYAIGDGAQRIVFAAQRPLVDTRSADHVDREIIIKHQALLDLLLGYQTFDHQALSDLYMQNGLASRPSNITINGGIIGGSVLYMSPDARYVVVKTLVTSQPPADWYRYEDAALKAQLPRGTISGRRFIFQFQVVDMKLHTSRPLLASPIPAGDYPDVLWAPDSKSVLLSHVLLPLDPDVPEQITSRLSKKFLVEVAVKDGHVTPISTEDIRLRSWDVTTGRVLGLTGSWSGGGSLFDGTRVEYEKREGLWMRLPGDGSARQAAGQINVTLAEGMNSPPKIYVNDPATGEKRLLLDLNPQFKHLLFGEVRDLGTLTNGELSVRAGIYLPVGYKAGLKYPLVIQTHEWSPERFWIDGPFDSAFAAQAFAGKGFIVAQIALNRNHQSTPREVREEAEGYDTVIQYLEKQGMIDTEKIGIIGFSRTTMGVKYELIHSHYHFAAATLADGSDAGYFRYIAYLTSSGGLTREAEGINGGIPAAEGLQAWLHNAADFDLAQISTPIRLEAYEPEALLTNWEQFGILTRLNRPVDFIYLPAADHVLIKPYDRLVSQGGNVDWFSFWLSASEDRLPSKAAQYERWHGLKAQQSAAVASSRTGLVHDDGEEPIAIPHR